MPQIQCGSSHRRFVNAADPVWKLPQGICERRRSSVGASLLAMNDNAVYRANRPGQPMMVFGRGVA
jgi:hypothetical protein